jgi:hypothetical protein
MLLSSPIPPHRGDTITTPGGSTGRAYLRGRVGPGIVRTAPTVAREASAA